MILLEIKNLWFIICDYLYERELAQYKDYYLN